MILIDQLAYRSKLCSVNGEEKFVFTLLTLLFCVVSRSILLAGIVFASTGILTIYVGGIPASRYFRLLRVPLVFLALSTAAVVINISRIPLDGFAIPMGGWYLTGSIAGLTRGIRLFTTALASVSCLYFLSLSTPMPDLLEVLRRFHVPDLLLELMLLTYRYIFLLLKTASSITAAQHSRLGNHSLSATRSSLAQMAGAVFLAALKRSSAQYDAMESRCYDGTIRCLKEHYPAKPREILALILFEAGLLLITILTWR